MYIRRSPILLVAMLLLVLTACAPAPREKSFFVPTPTPTQTLPPTPAPSLTQAATPLPGPTDTAALTAQTTPQASSNPGFIQQDMRSASTGWAVSVAQRILHTTQGLSAWQDVTPPEAQGSPAAAAAFINDQQAVLAAQVANPQTGSAAKILLWRTQDGGLTWTAGESITVSEEAGNAGLTQLIFLDAQHGWLLLQIHPGMNQVYTSIYATQDGGLHWTMAENGIESGPASGLNGSFSFAFGRQILAFVTEKTGFAGNGNLMMTVDGGSTWQPRSLARGPDYPALATPNEYAEPPRFTSPRDGAFLLRVDDADKVANPPGDIFFEPPQALYLYVTEDGGMNWYPYPAPARDGTFFFLDGKTGWFLGKDDPAPTGPTRLFQTGDGGQTWAPVEGAAAPPLGSDMQFVDTLHGFAWNPYAVPNSGMNPFKEYDVRAGDTAYLYQTEDGGSTWTQAY